MTDIYIYIYIIIYILLYIYNYIYTGIYIIIYSIYTDRESPVRNHGPRVKAHGN